MAVLVLTAWVGQVLKWLPQSLLARLDAWSLRKARASAQRRRDRRTGPAAGPPPTSPAP